MNIKRAKQEIKNAIEAYLTKNAYGEYQFPSIRQRPILLMGKYKMLPTHWIIPVMGRISLYSKLKCTC